MAPYLACTLEQPGGLWSRWWIGTAGSRFPTELRATQLLRTVTWIFLQFWWISGRGRRREEKKKKKRGGEKEKKRKKTPLSRIWWGYLQRENPASKKAVGRSRLNVGRFVRHSARHLILKLQQAIPGAGLSPKISCFHGFRLKIWSIVKSNLFSPITDRNIPNLKVKYVIHATRPGASFQKQREENSRNILWFSTSTLFNNTEGLINTHLKLPPGGTRYPRQA